MPTTGNDGRSGVSSPAEAAVVIHPSGRRSRRSPPARPPPKERSRLRSPRAFELLPARVQSRSLIRTPDLGSGRLGLKLAIPGWEENTFRSRLLPEQDDTGRSRLHPTGPGLERGSPRSGQTPWGTQAPAGIGDAFSLGTRFSPWSFQEDVAHIRRGCCRHRSRRGLQLGALGVGVGVQRALEVAGAAPGSEAGGWGWVGREPKPCWRGLGRRGRRPEALEGTFRIVS